MARNSESPLELNLKEWEFLPDTTSLLEFDFEDVKPLLSNDIIDKDYFLSDPCKLLQHSTNINHQDQEVKTSINLEHDLHTECTKSARSDLSVREIEHSQPSVVIDEKVVARGEEEEEEGEEERAILDGIRVGICNWRVTAVSALWSIGAVAAATVCVLVLGGRDGEQSRHRCVHRDRLQFHIQGDDKRLTKVVQDASKLNQALAAARGTPTMMRTANISFGGYYNSLD